MNDPPILVYLSDQAPAQINKILTKDSVTTCVDFVAVFL